MRTYNTLINRAEQGESVKANLKSALEFEVKQLNKMDLSGLIKPFNYESHNDYEAAVEIARAEYAQSVADATRNVPLLEAAMRKLGRDARTPKPQYNFAGYAPGENINDGPTGLGL